MCQSSICSNDLPSWKALVQANVIVNQSQLRMRPRGSWRRMQTSTGTCLSFHPGFWTEDSNIVNRKKKNRRKSKNTSQILVLPDFERDSASSCTVLIIYLVQKLILAVALPKTQPGAHWTSRAFDLDLRNSSKAEYSQRRGLCRADHEPQQSWIRFFVSFAADLMLPACQLML